MIKRMGKFDWCAVIEKQWCNLWKRQNVLSLHSVLNQPRLRTIDPGSGPWLVRITINPSGITSARACYRTSGARRGKPGLCIDVFIVFV